MYKLKLRKLLQNIHIENILNFNAININGLLDVLSLLKKITHFRHRPQPTHFISSCLLNLKSQATS